MNAKELEQIKARCEAATPGPMGEQIVELSWSTEDDLQYGYWVNDADGNVFAHVWSEADMKFVSHARADVPTLVSEVERLTAENVRLRALLEPAERACKVLSEYMRSGEFFDPETSKAVREWQALKGGTE